MPVDPTLFAAFLAAALVLAITPGPDMAFIIGQSISGGARRGLAANAGTVLGLLAHLVLAVTGISALLAATPGIFGAIRFAGAAYLLWIGTRLIMGALRGQGGRFVAAGPVRSSAAAFRQGLLTNLLNPKVVVFFLALLPQFIDPAYGPTWEQMLILGVTLIAVVAPFNSLVALTADRIARAFARYGRWLDGLAGTIFAALGLNLLVGALIRR